MNIFITGITGFIGAHLANHLSADPKNMIYGLARSIKNESTFSALKLIDKNNINIIFGDISYIHSDLEDIIIRYDIDNIYHLAAQPIVKNAALSPIPTYRTNIDGTINILEAMRLGSEKLDKRISTMIMSSDKAYGNSNLLPYIEDLALNGSDIYSSSKSCEDIISRAYAYNYDLAITVARPCNTYGECDFHWSRLVPTLAKTYLSKENIPLILNKGSYRYIREYIYVKDTVRALEMLIDNISKTRGRAFNISPDNKNTTEDVVDKFIEIMTQKYDVPKVPIQFKEKGKTFKEIESQYLDSTRMRNTTGWRPEFNLEKGLEKTIEGYKEWFDRSNQ